MTISSRDFASPPRDTKLAIRALDAALWIWKERIYLEARQANSKLHQRHCNSLDQMVSSAVNGKEFCSRAILTWAHAREVQLFFI